MKLDADGKKRLEAMKKALAAGVPLAGLLAGAAGCATEKGWHTMGRFPSPETAPEAQGGAAIAPVAAEEGTVVSEYVTKGVLLSDEPFEPPEAVEEDGDEFVTMGELAAPDIPENPENPEIPEETSDE